MTSREATPNLGAYSYFFKFIMSHKWLFLLIGILFVAILAACGKLEEPATGLEGASEIMKSTAQPASSASVAAPEAATVAMQTVKTEDKSAALSMADGLALAQKNNCLACHMIDKKSVGPAWIDVAKRYKGVAGIEHTLVIKVSTGAEGNWGNMPMPAVAPAVKEEDIRALVKFILSLAK